ncbi:hypothetical protein [Pseudomonas sp. MWU13-2105]|uniref:hypothetical protein n=1 Tax=Pseudomonas sp. MWU13-2105 TaxID=2935074 RepID=UPI00200BDDA9|nr:hypothetical protein [Pseudomonas sp. MWU13-2105]
MSKLLFDHAANQYELLGDGSGKDSLACLEEIARTLKKCDISFSGLYLEGTEMRASQGGKVYTLGQVYTQGAGEQRIIYPCFRDEFVFDFVRDITSFSLWKDMNEALAASYVQLKSDLVKESSAEAHRVNLVLTLDFIAMTHLEGERFRVKKEELDFLNGLICLYQLGVAQAKMRTFHGVSLANLMKSGAKSRRKRAVEHALNLLVGDDVADVKFYQVIAAQSPDSVASMQLLSKYHRQWKGVINTRQEFSNFLSSINLWSMPPSLFAGFHQLNALRTRSLRQVLLSLPAEGSAAWRGMFVSIHGELELFRKRELGRILRPGGRYYLELGADYSISNNELLIKYSAAAAQGVSFDGVVNIIGHGRDIERRVSGHPQKVAEWLYKNILDTYTATGFRKLKVINFQSCHIPQVLATHITCLLLERALFHFEQDRIPNVLIVSSPRTSLVLTSQLLLGHPRSSIWQEQHLVFPGHVLKAFRHLIDHSSGIQVAIKENFDWSRAFPEPNNLSFIDYLRRTHVLAVRQVSTSAKDFYYIEKTTFDLVRNIAQAEIDIRKVGLDECARLISDKFSESDGDIQKLVGIASIAEASRLLPVGEIETARKVIDFLAALKSARDSNDSLAGYRLYNETKVKFLIDPYDPYGAGKIRYISDIIFRLCGSPTPNSEAGYAAAYNKFFLLDKQEYRAMTGINIDFAAREFFKNYPYIQFAPSEFQSFQVASPQSDMMTVDAALRQSLWGSEQLGVSTRELRTLLVGGDETKILPALSQLEGNLKRKKTLLDDSRSLRNLQETQEQLGRVKSRIQKNKLSPSVLKSSARVATGSSRLLGAFGVFADFRTRPFHLDFSSAKSGVFTVSDSLAVVKGVFDFTTDIGPVLALRLSSSATRALWRPRLDQLFFKMNKVLLPLDVLFTAVSLYRNIEGAQLAKSAEEQALYITMTVIDAAAFGVNLAAFVLIGVPGVNVVLILVGAALAIVNIILNSIVSLSQLDNYRWNEKVDLFFGNMFGSSTLEGIQTQQQMRGVADQLFDGGDMNGTIITGLQGAGIDLFLTPMINDADDHDQTNPLKDIGTVSQGSSFRQEPRGYTLSPSGFGPDDLKTWADAKGRGKAGQVYKGWYLRRREARRGRERKLLVTMPSTPNTRLEVLDFGPVPTILLFGATPHLLLNVNPFGWTAGESPEEQARNKYQVRLHPGTSYTLQFKTNVMASNDLDSNFGSRTELIVPEGAFETLPQVSLDLSGQEDARASIPELDLSRSSLEVVKFKDKSTFKLDLLSTAGHIACALEQVVRTVQLPAHIQFKSGEQHPVMAVVGENSRITLRNKKGRSLLLLRREVSHCEIDLQASVSGFAVSI